jgi:hypothetical protein
MDGHASNLIPITAQFKDECGSRFKIAQAKEDMMEEELHTLDASRRSSR